MTGLLAFFLFDKRPRLQQLCVALSFIFIWLTATPWFKHQLLEISDASMHWLPNSEALAKPATSSVCQAQAIVVLGGGRRLQVLNAPQYHYQDLSSNSLERVRAAALLAKDRALPILVTGGAPDKSSEQDLPEANVMAWVLEKEYGLKVRWQETQSQTTQENAQLSAAILKKEAISCVILVTDYWHMPRASWVFNKAGLKVLAHPVGYHAESVKNPLSYYPNQLKEVREIWHELLGALWYRLRY